MKLLLNGCKIRKNIGVIEFQIIEDRSPGTEMNKFRAFVKKSSVIFIGFDNKERRLAKSGRQTEICGNPANEKSGRHAGIIKYPCEHGARRSFAVSSRDSQNPFFAQYILR